MKRNTILSFGLFALLLFFSACATETVSDARQENVQPNIYPDYLGVTIPVNIAPLNFCMADEKALCVDAVVTDSHGNNLHSQGEESTDFDIDDWHTLLGQNRGGSLSVTVSAKYDDGWHTYRPFSIYVSPDSIDYGISYRLIEPGYEVWSKMGIYERDLSSFEERALIENTQFEGCVNCHTSNRANPEQYVFHVRGKHGATVVHRDGKSELLQATNEILGGSMVYPYWHPGGRYCAFSTNKTFQMFHLANSKRIEVYDTSSDVFVYDTQTRQTLRDTLIMKEAWAENCPAFSPDGKWLYFITALRQEYPAGYDKERYSLCRVAFDDKTGKIGEQVDTLVRAAGNGKSVTWPRPSYDGRYVMYTQADYGYFTIWHKESDLWLLDLESGETRSMDEVNSGDTESFHNWDSSSRWFLFTSRRDDGLHTRLYFASVDDSGKVTKPFMLPQRNPKTYYRRQMFSYNTPDFTTSRIDADSHDTARRIRGNERVRTE